MSIGSYHYGKARIYFICRGISSKHGDEKGRLTIPAGWRPKNGGNGNGNDVHCLALPTPDGNITVYPPKMVAQLEARISQVSIGDIEGQKAITELMSMAHSLNCDRQGRINLNERLIAHAKIQKDVVLVGKLSTFSLFSDEGYEKISVFVHRG